MSKNKTHMKWDPPTWGQKGETYAACTAGTYCDEKLIFTEDLSRVTCLQCISKLFSIGKIKAVWA